ncbi:MAG: hypothetical protein WC343_05535 [Bacilli bacterium]|jgi:hypothetical protein
MTMNDLEIKTLLPMIFKEYQRMKESKKLYNDYDLLPQSIIKLYYSRIEPAPFVEIIDKFKKKYILNENKVEDVKQKQERAGLGAVYDFIQNDGWKKCDNLYVIMVLHQLLYSKVPYTEYGGKFRNANSIITNGGNAIGVDYNLVSPEIAALYDQYNDLVKRADELTNKNDTGKLIEYIDACLNLKCTIINPDYIDAMDKSIRCNDYSSIRKFYYYKICDSIYELDVKSRIPVESIKEVEGLEKTK